MTVRPLFVSLCGTDRQIVNGSRPDTATVLGHEAVCRVIWSSLAAIRVGATVVVNPVDSGDPRRVIGHSTEGLLQREREFSRREIAAGALVEVDSPPSALVALVEPLAEVISALQFLPTLPERASVVGDGGVASLAAIYLNLLGVTVHVHAKTDERASQLEPIVRVPSVGPGLGECGGTSVGLAVLCVPRYAFSAALELAAGELTDGGSVVSLGNAPVDDGYDDFIVARASNINGAHPRHAVTRIGPRGSYFLSGHRGTNATYIREAHAFIRANQEVLSEVLGKTLSLKDLPRVLEAWSEGASGSGPYPGTKYVVSVQSENSRKEES